MAAKQPSARSPAISPADNLPTSPDEYDFTRRDLPTGEEVRDHMNRVVAGWKDDPHAFSLRGGRVARVKKGSGNGK